MAFTVRKKLLASTLLISMAGFAVPAYAQTAAAPAKDAATDEADKSEDVVVTGSRIARPNIEANSPITSVDAQAFNLTGTITSETLLNELPQLIPGNTRVSNNQGGESFSTLDLRGLGPARTLILVDGERITPSSTTGVVDIATIPTGLIQRVDVVTGGASAVYGSDAVAGVVNYILQRNYQGLEVSSQYGLSEKGDGAEFNVQGKLGGNFGNGRGNLTVFGSYYTRAAVGQGDRSFSRDAGVLVFNNNDNRLRIETNPNNFNPGNSDFIFASGGSATPPWGVVVNNAANPFNVTFTNVDSDCNAATAGVTLTGGRNLSFNDAGQLIPSLTAGRCAFPTRGDGPSSRYNFNPANLLVTPFTRFTFSASGNYDVTDNVNFRLFANFTDSTQTVNLAPTPATGIVVPFNSPLIPADLAAALASRPNPTASFTINRRFSETGPRIGIYNSRSESVRGTFSGKISDDWKWNLTASWGQVNATNNALGNINRTAVTQGLNNCPTGSLPGCVPINLFGANTLTGAQLSFVRVDTKETRGFEEVRVTGNVNGTLFKLPGGPLAIAAGFERRTDRANINVDDAQRTGNIFGFNAVQNQRGSITVNELYGETVAPLLADLPFIKELSVEAGIRYSDYSSIGGLVNYKAGLTWAPVKALRFRGIYNKAARAPSVVELFQNGDQGFPTVTDPCNFRPAAGGGDARSASLIAFCQQQGIPAANIGSFQQVNSQVQAFAFGNPNLQEETAETYTLGAVLTPHLSFGGLTATIDYYNIKISNLIAPFGAQFFINDCYTNLNLASCARVVRDPATGQIEQVNTATGNQGEEVARGIDASVDFVFPLNKLFKNVGGRLRFSEVFSYNFEFSVNGTNFAGLNEAGIGGQFPRVKSTLTTVYETSSFTAQLRWNYSSSLREDITGDPTADSITPTLSYFDLTLSKKLGDHFSITGIAQNIFNQEPKATPIGFLDQANIDSTRYSNIVLGRTYKISATFKF